LRTALATLQQWVRESVSRPRRIGTSLFFAMILDNFEIVTAWVHPRYRNLGLAMELYASTMEVAQTQGVRYCTFDVLQGTIERMYEHSLFVGLLAKMGFLNWIFKMFVNRSS
jgi:ribosomal protein S18 acetylase RimI-like enzyme